MSASKCGVLIAVVGEKGSGKSVHIRKQIRKFGEKTIHLEFPDNNLKTIEDYLSKSWIVYVEMHVGLSRLKLKPDQIIDVEGKQS